MKEIAKLSLFILHLTGVALCLICTLVTIDQVVTLVPRYTSLGGWLSNLETDATHVVWLTTWSLGLAALAAMGLFCLDKPSKPRRSRTRSTMVRQAASSPSWQDDQDDQDELVVCWIDKESQGKDVLLAGLSSPPAR